MQAYFYINPCDNRTVDKLPYLLNIGKCGVAIHGDVSIYNPRITLNGDTITRIFECNYVHLPKFKRSYFVKDIVATTGNQLIIELSVDVLTSYSTDILTLECVVARQEHKNNPYLVDSKLPINVTKNVNYYNFGNSPFSIDNMAYGTYCVALTVTGGESSGEVIS